MKPALTPGATVRSEPELLLKSMFESAQAAARVPANVLGLYYHLRTWGFPRSTWTCKSRALLIPSLRDEVFCRAAPVSHCWQPFVEQSKTCTLPSHCSGAGPDSSSMSKPARGHECG